MESALNFKNSMACYELFWVSFQSCNIPCLPVIKQRGFLFIYRLPIMHHPPVDCGLSVGYSVRLLFNDSKLTYGLLHTVNFPYLEYTLSGTFRYLEQKSRSLQHLRSDVFINLLIISNYAFSNFSLSRIIIRVLG